MEYFRTVKAEFELRTRKVAPIMMTANLDNIGNRDANGGRVSAVSDYTANRLNQYTQRTTAPYVDVLGIANPTANVEVNNNVANRKGEYFHWPLYVANSSAQYPTITVESLYGATQTESGGVFVPPATESYTYDQDGNLTQDGRWNYEWDGENRLKVMRSRVGSPAPERRIEFAYDCQSRRIRKAVYNDRDNGQGTQLSGERFVYDGWNLIATLNSSFSLLQSYAWGLDLSGTEQGAGGVGGLLFVSDFASPNGHYAAAYDGNGSVTALVNAGDASVAAIYEYGPFGEPIRTSGVIGKANPFRFSTKFTDNETGLLYYGYRYYDPSTGRWPNRDPIEEQGGLNLYRFAHNAPINFIDVLGMEEWIWLSQSFEVNWSDFHPVLSPDFSHMKGLEEVKKWLKGNLKVPYRCREADHYVIWGNANIEDVDVDINTWIETFFGLRISVSGLTVKVGGAVSVIVEQTTDDPVPTSTHPDAAAGCKIATRTYTVTVKRGAVIGVVSPPPVDSPKTKTEIPVDQHQTKVTFTGTCCFCPAK